MGILRRVKALSHFSPTGCSLVSRGDKALGWHSFRRTFATLLKGGGEDVKTVQELMRHASSRLTLDVYAQALTPAKRAAHLKLVGLIQPAAETAIGPSWSHAEAAVAVSS